MSLKEILKKTNKKLETIIGKFDKLEPIVEYFDNGKVACNYNANKRGIQGSYEKYYENGQLEIKCTCKDGKKDGPYEEYHENGQLSIKCTYKDGELDGPYEEYSYGKNGNLWEKVSYRYIPVSETKETLGGGRCDVNGNMLENVGVFKPELRIKEGPFEEYHANGQLYRRGINKNGKEEGPYEIYSPDGVLVEKGIYREGLPLTEKGEIRKTVQVPPYRQTPSPEPSTKETPITREFSGATIVRRRDGGR